ncbi:unnamed protein product [Chrysoparadoxa australica]
MRKNSNIWQSAENMIVFYLLHSVDEFNLFRKSIAESASSPRLKKSLIVVIVENQEQKSILPNQPYFIYLTKSDFNWMGKLKNQEARQRFQTKYDLLLVYGNLKPNFVKLANKTNVEKRVTITEVENLKYDIKLQPESNQINQIASYTKEILGRIQS